MKLLLLIHSWSGADEIVARHWPYFLKAGADKIVGVSDEGGNSRFPEGVEVTCIGDDMYMHGDNLCRRLLLTMLFAFDQQDFDRFAIAEYDCVFFKPIPEFDGICSYHAGGANWGSKATTGFYHNPWMFDRESGLKLAMEMEKIIHEGHCTAGSPESSPDVFFAWAAERAGLTVKSLLKEYSRNNIDTQQYLDEARKAVQGGADVIHGVKTKTQLDYITSEQVPNDFLDVEGIRLATAFTPEYERARAYVESLHKHCNVPNQLIVIGQDMPVTEMPNQIVQAGHFLRYLYKCRTLIFTDADMVMHRPLDKDEIDFINGIEEGQISACTNKHIDQKWDEEIQMLSQVHPLEGYDDVPVFNTGFIIVRLGTYATMFEEFKKLWPEFDSAFRHYAKIQLCICAVAHRMGIKWIPTPAHLCSHGHFACPVGVELTHPPTANGRVIAFDHRVTN